jgi:hypothetical protein
MDRRAPFASREAAVARTRALHRALHRAQSDRGGRC